METFLLVHPRFFFFFFSFFSQIIWFMKQIIIWKGNKQTNKKAFFFHAIYITNTDEKRRCANPFPCKQLHHVVQVLG